MIIKIRKIYDIESNYTINDALESCIVKKEHNNLVNTMTLVYSRNGEHASLFVVGALVWGYEEKAGELYQNITDTYIITHVKITNKKIEATAEEVCRYILRRSAILPMTSYGALQNVVQDMISNAVPDFSSASNYYQIAIYPSYSPICSIEITTPKTFLDALKGSEGSIADVTNARITLGSRIRYGGETSGINIWINFSQYADTVSDYIVYGREITEATIENDLDYYVVNTVPYWKGSVNDTETVVTNGVASPAISMRHYLFAMTDVMDISSKYTVVPPPAKLTSAGEKYVRERRAQFSDGNYYVKIRDGIEYRKYDLNMQETSALKKVNAEIGNLISVMLEDGSKIAARVTQTEYDMLRERYTKIDLGEKIDSFSRMLAKDIKGN